MAQPCQSGLLLGNDQCRRDCREPSTKSKDSEWSQMLRSWAPAGRCNGVHVNPPGLWLKIFFATLYMLLQHINSLTDIFKEHRNHAEEHFRDDIRSKARPLADKLGIDLILPRICSRQTHWVNTAGLDFESYYRTRLYSVSWFVSVVIDVSLFQQ